MAVKHRKSTFLAKGLAWGWVLCFIGASGLGLYVNKKFLFFGNRTHTTVQNSEIDTQDLVRRGELSQAAEKVSATHPDTEARRASERGRGRPIILEHSSARGAGSQPAVSALLRTLLAFVAVSAVSLSQPTPKRLVILGSTGSIGTQTLDVVGQFPDRFEVVGLAASRMSPAFQAAKVA